jgi:hypothetical protein
MAMNSMRSGPTGLRGAAQALLPLLLTLAAILLVAGGTAVLAQDAPKSAGASARAGERDTQAATPSVTPVEGAPAVSADDLDSLLGPEPPTRVRVAILNATGKAGGANKVAVLLGEYKRQALEDQIGLQIEVVNLSATEIARPGQSILFYRPEFLRAALAMAKAIPGDQFVEPMRPASLKRAGVDVEIVVGKELP